MLPQISLHDARARTWDVILVGSSFASMFFLRGLPPGLSVLIVEKGDILPHEERLKTEEIRPVSVTQTNSSGKEKVWVMNAVFGGNSLCWWGQTPRFHPDDFHMRSRFGVAEDWPLDYETLEPFYHEVERVMEIAGGGSDHILPRSRPFPFPPHAPARSDQVLQAADTLWVPSSAARSNGGTRAGCCANGICHRCPVDAKFSIPNGIARFERPDLFLLTETDVRSINVEAGTATGVAVRGAGGSHEIRADLVALGANAIFNAAILMRSGFAAPALGRYLHEQAAVRAQVDAPLKNFFGGTSITGLGYHFYHNFDRAKRAAVLIENYNVPAAIRPERGRWTERLTLNLIAEDIPQADNRVVLVEEDPHLEWRGHSKYSREGLDYAKANLANVIPTQIDEIAFLRESITEAHIQGTTRMGKDAEDSVVNKNLRTHEVPNVLALGAGAFPSCSPANPTLTLSALSLYAAKTL